MSQRLDKVLAEEFCQADEERLEERSIPRLGSGDTGEDITGCVLLKGVDLGGGSQLYRSEYQLTLDIGDYPSYVRNTKLLGVEMCELVVSSRSCSCP